MPKSLSSHDNVFSETYHVCALDIKVRKSLANISAI